MNKTKPYKAYDVMTGELVGTYDLPHEAYDAHPTLGLSVIYRPSKKRAPRKEFPYNG